jgi:hypothetical protein
MQKAAKNPGRQAKKRKKRADEQKKQLLLDLQNAAISLSPRGESHDTITEAESSLLLVCDETIYFVKGSGNRKILPDCLLLLCVVRGNAVSEQAERSWSTIQKRNNHY